ncbi:MAG: S-layer homology domain-containing protein [Candidatus Yonathbacteria bacterium]|nr:S-layer homology domain-containing protein [Candidatus Yonathbacteria bacterium]
MKDVILKQLKKFIAVFSLSTVIFTIVGMTPIASAADITAVAMVDSDSTGFGIDGRDFSISWTPGTQPAGFTDNRIYILPSTITPTVNNISVTGGSSACAPNLVCISMFSAVTYSQNSVALPQSTLKDSNSTNFSAGTSYKAWIYTNATTPSLVGTSGTMSPVSDVPTDTASPIIQHYAVMKMATGVNALIYAQLTDDQTTAAQFNDVSDIATNQEIIQLKYGANVASARTSLNGVRVEGNLFSFTIPSADVPAAGQSLQYYIAAKDRAGNSRFFCASPSATTEANCQASPFTVTSEAAGSRTVSGTTKKLLDGTLTAEAGVKVYTSYGMAAVTSDGSGNYTISGLPNNNAFDIIPYKAGLCGNNRFETIFAANLTGIDLTLNNNDCTFGPPAGGGGGGTTSATGPHRVFSGPPDNSMSAPLNQPIRVGFDQALDASTVNDTDASNTASNVYLTSDGTTKIAGSVVYCANSSAAGCSSLPSMDANVIVFTPSAALTANTSYTLVITSAVANSTGQSVTGKLSGGGDSVTFMTGGGTLSGATVAANFGTAGYAPPFVTSVTPGPGISVTPGTKFTVNFNQAMDSSSINTTNVVLSNSSGSPVTTSVSLDSNTKQIATITPSANLDTGEYKLKVLGGAKSLSGITMRPVANAADSAFETTIKVAGTADATAPTIFPSLASGATGVPVGDALVFGFNETIDPSTVSNTNVVLRRNGTTDVGITTVYQLSNNNLYVVPNDALAPSTSYTVTFNASGVKDLSGNSVAATSYTYTTGNVDTTAPKLNASKTKCDNVTCSVVFSELMNSKKNVDGVTPYAGSVINPANMSVTVSTDGGTTFGSNVITTQVGTWDPVSNSVTFTFATSIGTPGSVVKVTVGAGAKDMSGNAIVTTSSANIFQGKLADNAATGGMLNSSGAMFGPPTIGGGGTMGASVTKAEMAGGGFTAAQFAMGQTNQAYPFNMMAGKDVNVFQTRFSPGTALQNGDFVIITFPSGTSVTNAVPDDQSPFKADFNMGGPGTITFDATYDSDGVAVDTANNTVTIKLTVTGTPTANDNVTIDLRKITNPSIPKGPDTGGYTVSAQILRGATVLKDITNFMPYFIQQAGSRSITINIYAGSQASPTSGANGNVFLHGGGPSGPMDKTVTLTNGIITAVDGTSASSIAYTGLNDGCYYLGTDPFVTLGGNDYYGQMQPEPVCVNSTTASATKNIVLGSATTAGGAAVAVTVKFAGIATFNGADVDIFAGGPGKFVVKTLSALGAPDAAGYALKLNQNGHWFIGARPTMNKTTTGGPMAMTASMTKTSAIQFQPPVDIVISGIGGTTAVALGPNVPPGVSFDSATNTLTFTYATADKPITGTVNDGTTGLANVNVFVHRQGFGAPSMTQTDSTGAFTVNVAEYGEYEIGVMKDGLPPFMSSIGVHSDGNYFKGKLISGGNPLVISIKKGAYTISGKVLDASNNAIPYAPIFAKDANGNIVNGQSGSDGSYSVFVDNGTWTVKSMLPPSKTDLCGTLSVTVIVSGENKSSQNITPSTSTCYTLGGTVTVNATALANVPVQIQEWDTTNNRPADGGFMRPTSTNSSGVYTSKVPGNKTYKVSIWDPSYGELSVNQAVVATDITNADVNSGTMGTITFAFTGGTSSNQAFIEVKLSTDKFTRLNKNQKGLTSNVTFTAKAGTYNYFVDVFGVGKFTGTVATGATATIDLSTTANALLTLSGNVKDSSGNNLSGAFVAAVDSTGFMVNATTNSSGNYSMSLKAGTYNVGAGLAGYVPGQAPASLSLTANTTNYDFGGAAPDQQALTKAGNVITGTIYKSDGTTPVTDGFAFASNTAGLVSNAPVSSQNGSYSLPVTNGTWTVYGVAPGHAKTAKTGTVTIAGADSTGNNITLTVDATKATKTTSSSLTASTGGTVDDTANTGIKVTAGSGVLGSSGDATLSEEKTYTAPQTSTAKPLGDATYAVTATSTSGTIKDLSGTANIDLAYSETDLPSGVTEDKLKCGYYDATTAEYKTVEGGFTVDSTNNTITCNTTHLTDFVIFYPSSLTATAAASTTTTTGSVVGSAGGGNASGAAAASKVAVAPEAVLSTNVATAVTVAETGKVDTAVSVQATASKAAFTIDAGTEVTKADGSKFTGKLEAPAAVTASVNAPSGAVYVSNVFEVGASASGVTFSKPVTVVVPLSESVKETDTLSVYVFNAKTSAWDYVGKGTVKMLSGQQVVEFAVTHFSKYVVTKEVSPEVEKELKAVFVDTMKHWAKGYIENLYNKGFVKGYDKDHFGPDKFITRAEFTKIAVMAFGIPVMKASEISFLPFNDVKTSNWAAPYVQAAFVWNIVAGYADGTFKPDQLINRAEALRILLDAAKVKVDSSASVGGTFPDIAKGAWYVNYVNYAAANKIVSGYKDGTFGPGNNVTRGEVAKIVSVMLEMGLGNDSVVGMVLDTVLG